jgi:IS30 family transposase
VITQREAQRHSIRKISAAFHAKIDKALASTAYFADLYSRLQRGLKENLNRLIRQYICNSHLLTNINDTYFSEIEKHVSSRYRKRMNTNTL